MRWFEMFEETTRATSVQMDSCSAAEVDSALTGRPTVQANQSCFDTW